MSKDELYTAQAASSGSFRFDEAVAEVFPDMLRRSIPGYGASIEAIGDLAARFVQPGTNCYDLGCSLGAASLAIQRNIRGRGCRIIAVDNSPAMVARCKENLSSEPRSETEISVLEDDVLLIPIDGASMVVMNYTMQFLAPAKRDEMVQKIGRGLLPGGIFLLSEKVVDEDQALEDIVADLHYQFKRRNRYSDQEIARKRTAIEDVLIPDTMARHYERLQAAGFRHYGVWLRHFNFVSIVATR